jgi:hypothetical protein
MSNLVNEILLRLSKLVVAAIVAAIVYMVAVAVAGASPSFELAALCWLSSSAGLLLVESSPI